jgi:inner membrane protease subunit 1
VSSTRTVHRNRLPRVQFSGKTGETTTKSLSRAERRLLERKQNKIEKRDEARVVKEKQQQEKVIVAPSKIRDRLMRIVHPRILGSGVYLRGEHLVSFGYRLPFFLALCYVLTNEDCSPYVIQGSIGPSMLPTIQFIGDLWLVETGAWYRLLRWKPSYQVGDIVLWRDPATGRVSCKRIVGMEGDQVQRYGQYAHDLYQNQEDWAIVWPSDAEARKLDKECPWDIEKSKDIKRTIEVPPGHIWLEGDFPPFSLDSRHYGPIPISWVCGRLMLRVWPMQREDEEGSPILAWVSRDRPMPFPSIDHYLGKRFNFYRVPKVETQTE